MVNDLRTLLRDGDTAVELDKWGGKLLWTTAMDNSVFMWRFIEDIDLGRFLWQISTYSCNRSLHYNIGKAFKEYEGLQH